MGIKIYSQIGEEAEKRAKTSYVDRSNEISRNWCRRREMSWSIHRESWKRTGKYTMIYADVAIEGIPFSLHNALLSSGRVESYNGF